MTTGTVSLDEIVRDPANPMTSLSDGLGPQKDPNSGRTRVESGPAGTHRPTTRRGSAIGASRGPRPETAGPGRRRRRRPIASTLGTSTHRRHRVWSPAPRDPAAGARSGDILRFRLIYQGPLRTDKAVRVRQK